MAYTPRVPNSTPPRAPLRGMGPSVPDQEAMKAKLEALARKRMQTPAAPGPQKPSSQSQSVPSYAMGMPAQKPGGAPQTPAQKAQAAAGSGQDVRKQALAGLKSAIVPGQSSAGASPKAKTFGETKQSKPTRYQVDDGYSGSMPPPDGMEGLDEEDRLAPSEEQLKDKGTPIFGKQWDYKTERWVDLDPYSSAQLPPGVDENTPGVFFDAEKNLWVYDPEGGADSDAIDAQLEAALTSSPEDYGMSDKLLAENLQGIDRQGADAKSKLSQQLAGRGLGASGLAGSGFGNIDVGTQAAKTELLTQNFQTGVEARLNELKTLLTAHGNELSEKNRVEIAKQIADAEKQQREYEKLSQKEADQFTFLHNTLANLGSDQWDADAYAYALKLIKGGASYEDVLDMFEVADKGGTPTVFLTSKAKKAAAGNTSTPAAGAEDTTDTGDEVDTSNPPPGWGSPADWTTVDATKRKYEWWKHDTEIDLSEPPPGVNSKGWADMPEYKRDGAWLKWYLANERE